MNQKSILVTGGTGSWGQAFTRRVLKDNPRRLVIFSRDEQKQEQMERELQHPSLRFFIGDVRDRDRLELAMQGIDIVFHAAAMKIIPKCELDPYECIKTNLIGAQNVTEAARRAGVRRVMALSTDKACAPLNLYGASKLAAEKLFIAANRVNPGTDYSVVRYGNVWGSRGSVVPLFKKQYEAGKNLTITDERMTRFNITLDQAIELVLTSVDLMQGGEVFVPKLPSYRITDVAEAIAPGHPIDVIGIRPGEKLHEMMFTEDEARLTEDIGDRYVIRTEAPAKPCTDAYSSGANHDWLTVEGLRLLIGPDTDRPQNRGVAKDFLYPFVDRGLKRAKGAVASL